MSKTKKTALLGLLAAIAIVINLVEAAFIPPLQFGIRLGLANIVALVTLQLFGVKEMWTVNLLRLSLGNLLKGILFGAPFWISASGIFLSSLSLLLTRRLKSSVLFSSILSALAHSLGQLLCVILLYAQPGIAVLLPTLLVSSLLTGILTGSIAVQVLRRIRL